MGAMKKIENMEKNLENLSPDMFTFAEYDWLVQQIVRLSIKGHFRSMTQTPQSVLDIPTTPTGLPPGEYSQKTKWQCSS